jgi:hypothetical protein
MGFEEHVHIIPLGFEIDRAVILLEKIPANRVYILVNPPDPKSPRDNEEKDHCLNEVRNKLERKDVAVIVEEVNLFDIKDVMKSVARLVLAEKSKGNNVYVNISAAGKLTSVGATFAAMAHNAKVYYAAADRYSNDEKDRKVHGLSICDHPKGTVLENFQISLPDDAGRIVLTSLCKKGSKMSTDEILSLLVSNKIVNFQEEKTISSSEKRRKVQQRNRINLNKAVLDKLEKAKYINREKIGRYNKISLTESGKYMANLVGLL